MSIITRSFFVESKNYSSHIASNSYSISIDMNIIPKTKTIKRYEIALEEAIYNWLEKGDEESIVKLLLDAKENGKLPTNFFSQENTLRGTDSTWRLKIVKREKIVELKKIGYGSVSSEDLIKLERVIKTLRKIYDVV